jgi:hypothetical protein
MSVPTAFSDDYITVTRSEGSRGADGWTEDSTKTVLSADGDLQQSGRAYENRAAHYEVGDALFFADGDVSDVEVGDSATVNGSLGATVEEVMPIDDSLLLSLDG